MAPVNAPPPVPPDDYEDHLGTSRQYLRDIILGVNDGLVSTFLLVSAVVGGGLTATQVLLTGVAGALAGMISMGIGEYLATKSQEEVLTSELGLERKHIAEHRQMELDQLRGMFDDMGVLEEDLDGVVAAFDRSDEALLNAMVDAFNAQIASAAEEQTAVAEEINRSVHQIAVAVAGLARVLPATLL